MMMQGVDPKEIIAQVERTFLNTTKLRQRMDDDYARWMLRYQFETDSNALVGYERYNSNEPRTFARKGIAMLNSAAMSIKCPQENDPRQQRDKDNDKERFARGNLKANDERLVRA